IKRSWNVAAQMQTIQPIESALFFSPCEPTHVIPLSSYLLYYYDTHLKVQQDFPNLPRSEINKKISESWRRLSVAEKSIYLEKAKLEKEGIDPVRPFNYNLCGFPPLPPKKNLLNASRYLTGAFH
uniref:HMG box domain-containing protein n=1 Tax=Callorhinchus milii TaxID=7868 RepID=A0A4W3GIG2_CALMI